MYLQPHPPSGGNARVASEVEILGGVGADAMFSAVVYTIPRSPEVKMFDIFPDSAQGLHIQRRKGDMGALMREGFEFGIATPSVSTTRRLDFNS